MDSATVYSIIQRLSSGDTVSAEQELESYRKSHIDDLISSIFEVIAKFNSDIPVIQSALLILKIIIPKAWSIGFEEYEGPPISQDLKSKSRALLIELLGHEASKVRSVAALLASRIASVEYPDDWPDLIDQISNLVLNGNQSQIFGALATLKELVGETITEAEFRQVGFTLLNTLYAVASSPAESTTAATTSTTTTNNTINEQPPNTQSFSPIATAIALQIFCQCADLLAIPTDPNSPEAQIASQVVNQWAPILVSYIGKPSDPTDIGWTYVKIESLKAFASILTTVPKQVAPFAPQAFESIIQSLQFLLSSYYKNVVSSSSFDNLERNPSWVFIPETVNLESLVYEEFELLVDLLGHSSIARKLTNDVQAFFDLLIQYAQISKADEDLWQDDMNEFLREEGEFSIKKDVRSEIPDILSALFKTRQLNLVSVFTEKSLALFQTESSWKLKEASLYLLTWLLAEDHDSHNQLPQEIIDKLITHISEFHFDSNVLLRARSFIAGASLCKSLSDRVDLATVKIPLFESTANSAVSDTNDTVKSACLISFQKFCPLLPHEYLVTKLNVLYQIVSAMTPNADEDTPTMFAEVLLAIIEADLVQAVRNPNLIEIIYNLLSRDPTNIMLTNEIEDMMEQLAETATDEDYYLDFVQHSLPPLLQSILSIKDWDYTPELVLSLNILGVIIDKGPYPVPEDILNTFFEPLYKIVMNSSDNQVLQTATEILSFLTSHASAQLQTWTNSEGRNGIELLIVAVARLLEPVWEDSACINTGLLILAIVNKFGQFLGDYIPQILEATAKRLAIAKHPVLIENFIRVFSELVASSAADVVDFLSNQSIDIVSPDSISSTTTTGLQVVLSKWVSNFDVLRGYDEIKSNIVALGKLYELQDPRIANIIVEGDPLPAPDDVILTRSKTRQLGAVYTKVSVPVKIIKLFLRELIMGKFTVSKDANAAMQQQQTSSSKLNDGHGNEENRLNDEGNGDDEWEDLEEDPILEGGITYSEALKYAGIEDIDGEELLADDRNPEAFANRRAWAGSDYGTQLMIADWIKQVIGSDVGNFKESIFPQLSREEQKYLEILLS